MMTSSAGAASGDTSAAEQPRADCTADSAGGLTFDITLPGESERWDAGLLLRRRGTDPIETVRLPLVPAGEGALRAVLPSTVPLTEGRWNAYLVLGEGSPRRLLPGLTDLGPLLDRVPRVGRTWLGVRIPYRTRHGNLALRAWLRWPHAEAAGLLMDGRVLTLHGRLFGADLTPETRVELRPGQAGRPVLTAPAVAEGPGFVCRIPLAGLTADEDASAGGDVSADREADGDAEERSWEVWLRTRPSAEAVRVGRILDDQPDKRYTVESPRVPLADAAGVVARIRYTADNDVSLCLEPAGMSPV
ncbi:hypothetical protein [Streptomyces sparsus]